LAFLSLDCVAVLFGVGDFVVAVLSIMFQSRLAGWDEERALFFAAWVQQPQR